MKLPDTEQFNFKECVIAGDECWLIIPDSIKCKWTDDNLKFRSMIVRKSDNRIVSRGYDKFFNYSEQPDINKFPDGPFDAIENKDGYIIIWGIFKDTLIHRTRGTTDASDMPNGHEIEFLKKKYPQLLVAIYNNREYSILTEWQTKTNVIVISEVEEPTLILVGVIHNQTGTLVKQEELDKIAEMWGLARPKRHHYDTISECIDDVEKWIGSEGVVIYSECGQYLRKCKSDWYKSLHALATGIKSIQNVLGVFMESPRYTKSEEFFKYIEQVKDYEIAVKCEEYIEEICEAYRKVLDKIKKADNLVEGLRGLTRREQATEILNHWRDWRKGYAFSKLDGKEMDDKTLRKAIEKELNLKN
jgi:T4 RnlA family RNA ligase